MPVDHRQEEIIALAQIFFDTADHQRAVGVANFFGDHADCVSSFQAQSARKKVRPVIERFRGFDDAILGVLGNGTRRSRVIQRSRHRSGREPEMLRNGLERDLWFAAMRWLLSRRKHHFYLVLRTSSKNGIFETGRRIGNRVSASAPDPPISRDPCATWLLRTKPWMQVSGGKVRPRVGIVLHLYG